VPPVYVVDAVECEFQQPCSHIKIPVKKDTTQNDSQLFEFKVDTGTERTCISADLINSVKPVSAGIPFLLLILFTKRLFI
jgi:hypothetical protein